MDITHITPDVTRIRIPFLDVYTSVFLIGTEAGYLLFDTATYPTDIAEHLLPALSSLGIRKEALAAVLISHPHRDHAGGLAALLEECPGLSVIAGSDALLATHGGARLSVAADGDVLFGVLRIVAIPGHTADSIAVLDLRTGTLLSGDGLQLYGLFGSGWWGANITMPQAHLAALERLAELPITAIYPAHDYHPEGDAFIGQAAVARALAACREPLFLIRDMIIADPQADDKAIAAAYNEKKTLPPLGWPVVAAVRRELL